jgi:hypothetical protein
MLKRTLRLLILGSIILGLLAASTPVAAYVPPEGSSPDSPIVLTATTVLGDPQENGDPIIPTAGGRPGVYIARDYDNLDPSVYPITGGYQTFVWKDLEPAQGVYNWAPIDAFLNAMQSSGKAGALHITTYNGPYEGGVGMPTWLRSLYPDLVLSMYPKLTSTAEPWRAAKPSYCSSYPTTEGIKYWDTRYLNAYHNFINALGARYKYDSRVEFIMAGTGLYGETQPAHDCYDYYLLDLGLTDSVWTSVVQQIAGYYSTAFSGGSIPTKSNMILAAPTYFHTCDRKLIMDYVRTVGLGDLDAGLLADYANAVIPDKPGFEGCGRLDPLLATQPTLPVGWESYWYLTPHETLVYWAVLQALALHLDYITVDYAPNDSIHDGWMFEDYAGNLRYNIMDIFRWAKPYFGKSPANAPSVWVAMRDSGYSYYPWHSNYSYYLYQDDSIAGGHTKVVTYRGTVDPSDSSQLALLSYLAPYGEEYNTSVQTSVNLGGSWVGKESWIARRTDQGTGNPYMWLKVDDGYLFGGSNTVTVKVTYFDYGTDSWKLDYDGAGGVQRTAGIVSKTNTRTWKVKTFTITDARFGNGLLGSSDMRIDCNSDGDEYIHFVEVVKGSGSTTNFDIPLRTGWNFISIPLNLSSTDTQTVLSPISGKYTKVYAYDSSDTSDPWKIYDTSLPPFLNDLTTITNVKGLWLWATQDTTFTVNGTWPASSTNITLKTGWNLIGYPSQTTRAVADALNSIAGKWTKVYTYNAFDDSDPWKINDTSLPPFLNDLTQMEPGRAYWLYVTQDCTLSVPN